MNAYLVSTVAIIVAVLAVIAFLVTLRLYRWHVDDLRAALADRGQRITALQADRNMWEYRARRDGADLTQCRRALQEWQLALREWQFASQEWQLAHLRLIAEVSVAREQADTDWEVVDRNAEHWATPDGHAQRDAAFRQIVSVLPSDDAVNLGLWTSELDPETCLLAESLTDNPGQVDK